MRYTIERELVEWCTITLSETEVAGLTPDEIEDLVRTCSEDSRWDSVIKSEVIS